MKTHNLNTAFEHVVWFVIIACKIRHSLEWGWVKEPNRQKIRKTNQTNKQRDTHRKYRNKD